jgi:hypothetical protein
LTGQEWIKIGTNRGSGKGHTPKANLDPVFLLYFFDVFLGIGEIVGIEGE